MSLRPCASGCGSFLASLDGHDHCLTCLGREHTEAVFTDGSCVHCERMTMVALKSRRSFASRLPSLSFRGKSLSRQGFSAATARYLGDIQVIMQNAPPASKAPWTSAPPRGPVECPKQFASPHAGPRVSFGAQQEVEMSATASEGESEDEADVSACRRPSAVAAPSEADAKLLAMLLRAAKEIGLEVPKTSTADPSRLDDWFLGRSPVAPPRSPPVAFFPEVHEELAGSLASASQPLAVVDSAVLCVEVAVLLAKDAIEAVPPAEMKSGFYSPYFIVPKKSGGLRPILDLRALNRSLLRLPFKMLTTKRMLTCIRHQDWFAAIDLEDTYFHVSILPRHRPFLRFAFEGRAYQYKVLPFGLSLSPRVFTKVTEAALSPLWWMGIRILNYLDDWLLIAHSRDVLCKHRDLVLRHLSHLGLQVKREKSKLSPVQRISFLGVELDSVNMTARLTNECAQSRLLGHMAAAATVTPLGLLHMRPLQHWFPCSVATCSARGQTGVPLGQVSRHLVVYTDASSTGWGAVCNGQAASGSWTGPRLQWHINCLELLAVLLALRRFRPMMRHKHVLVRTDSTATVAYINHQGGLRSGRMSQLARHLLLWSQTWLKSLRAVHIPGELNRSADQLSWQSTHPGEWRLHPQLFYSLSEAPLGRDELAHSWPPGPKYAFPPVSLLAQTLQDQGGRGAGSHGEDPQRCPIAVVFSFLQEKLERRLSPSTLKRIMMQWMEHPLVSTNRRTEQLFVCFGGQQKGNAVSKQRLAHWVVDAISLSYQNQGEPCPLGVHAHSTRSVASSYALAHGASLADICRAAGRATPNTFARFYNLRVEAVSSRVLT
ncbi:Transposon Ty3-G Gag-Pol polyprotein [Labeo rohita]|uniref:ribonuclease H n=1 Tax=Labeo rohita TaxID=84645 RepID=A0ABQ8L1A5_LABRO|nr:Transposon Ty3-G Gag-Pol polyprotein [Labeo rohita]